MTMGADINVNARLFHIESIEKSMPPRNETQGEWWHYTIVCQSTRIDGKRAGTRTSVLSYVEEYVRILNYRATHGYPGHAARKVRK